MATRSRTTFQKRQKELARAEKQRDKAARRLQRKLEKHSGLDAIDEPANPSGDETERPPDASAMPGDLL